LAGGLWASSGLGAQPTCGPDPATLRSINRALPERAVRIELFDGKRYSPVKEVEVTAEAVTGRLHGERFEVPTAQVRLLETLAKRRPLPRFLRGLAIGLGVGAAFYLSSRHSDGILRPKSSVIATGGAIGGGIGGIVGLAAPALDGEVLCEGLKPAT
jgi:hypothetical protein